MERGEHSAGPAHDLLDQASKTLPSATNLEMACKKPSLVGVHGLRLRFPPLAARCIASRTRALNARSSAPLSALFIRAWASFASSHEVLTPVALSESEKRCILADSLRT